MLKRKHSTLIDLTELDDEPNSPVSKRKHRKTVEFVDLSEEPDGSDEDSLVDLSPPPRQKQKQKEKQKHSQVRAARAEVEQQGPRPNTAIGAQRGVSVRCRKLFIRAVKAGLTAPPHRRTLLFPVRVPDAVKGDDRLILAWALQTFKGKLRSVPEDKLVKQFNCRFQFHLEYVSPQMEAEFQALKQQHGSFFAFHGSPFYNVWGILQQSIQPMSGTKYQENGAVFGSGVYLARNLSLVLGYASMAARVMKMAPRITRNWSGVGAQYMAEQVMAPKHKLFAHIVNPWFPPNSVSTTKDYALVLVCEVVAHQISHHPGPDYYVAARRNTVMPRLLLALTQEEISSMNLVPTPGHGKRPVNTCCRRTEENIRSQVDALARLP